MADDRTIALTDPQIEKAWQLTFAMVANEDSSKRSLDQLFLNAARFVERVEEGLAGAGVDLDTGKAPPGQRITWRVVRKP